MLEKEIQLARELISELNRESPQDVKTILSIIDQIRKLVLAEAKITQDNEAIELELPRGLWGQGDDEED